MHSWLLKCIASVAGRFLLLTQFMSSQGLYFLLVISLIFLSKKFCFIFLTILLNLFQSSSCWVCLYVSKSLWQLSFHHILEYLVMLITLECLCYILSILFVNNWMMVLRDLTLCIKCQTWFTPGWKSAEWTQRWADLWNDLGFSLCAALSVCCMVATSDEGEEVLVGVSTDWCVTVEHWRLSSIRGYLHWLSD